MGSRRMVGAVLVALGASTLVAVAGAPSAQARSCGWTVQISGDQVNALYPDQAARYWVALSVPLPPGGYIEVKGQFPHARYTSLNTYDTQTRAIDAIHDTDYRPDPGSTNPFLPGANRTAPKRGYTIKVVGTAVPAQGRAPNTLYTASADGTKTTGGPRANIALRIYEPDRGTDEYGGVPLPSLTVVTATGQRLTLPDCGSPDLPDLGVQQAEAAAGFPLPVLTGVFARRDTTWHKYDNLETTLVDGTTDNDVAGSLEPGLTGVTQSTFASGGFGENVDNKYIYTTIGSDLGQVFVMRGKLPTTPRTLDGEARMGTGQLRYWSMCTENGASQFYACLTDDAVPTDRSGYYTIAISTSAYRPSDATVACGIQWLPAGPVPQTVLLMRNMLPSPGFTQSVQNARIGHEQQDLGPYYPTSTYYATTAAAEQALGCPAKGAGR